MKKKPSGPRLLKNSGCLCPSLMFTVCKCVINRDVRMCVLVMCTINYLKCICCCPTSILEIETKGLFNKVFQNSSVRIHNSEG